MNKDAGNILIVNFNEKGKWLPLLFIHLAISTIHVKAMFSPSVAIVHCGCYYIKHRVFLIDLSFISFNLQNFYY